MLENRRTPYPKSPVVPGPPGLKTPPSTLATACSAALPAQVRRGRSPPRSVCLKTGIILKLLTHFSAKTRHPEKLKKLSLQQCIQCENTVPNEDQKTSYLPRSHVDGVHADRRCNGKDQITHNDSETRLRATVRPPPASPGSALDGHEASGFCRSSSSFASFSGSGT